MVSLPFALVCVHAALSVAASVYFREVGDLRANFSHINAVCHHIGRAYHLAYQLECPSCSVAVQELIN